MNNISSPPESSSDPRAFTTAMEETSNINVRELLDILWSGKWLILATAALFTFFSIIHAITAQPIYQSNGLIQVEQQKSALSASVNELSALIGAAPADASAEIAIVKSRMVLGAVSENLRLYIRVTPDYFPYFGEAYARRNYDGAKFRNPPGWLKKYAWGGEKITVTSFDVPETWYDRLFLLEARENGYALLDRREQLLLDGQIGERHSIQTPDGPLSIFVQELSARPGTRFLLRHLSDAVILEETASRIAVVEQPRDSGVLTLTVQAEDPRFAARLLNAVQEAYLKQNVERKSAQAEQSLEFLKGQLPDLKARVDAAQAQLNSYQLKKGTVDVQQETQLVLQRTVQLETQRLTLVQEREAALQRFTSQHPVVVTLTEQIRGLEREQSTIKKQVETLPETQQEILSLMRDLEVNTQLYTGLLNSAQELQVTKAGTVGNVRIIDRGLVPLAPIKPRKTVIVMIGFMLGIFAGVAAVFAMRSLIRGVDRPEEVERALGLPTYASIPYSQAQQSIMRRLNRKSGELSNYVLASADSSDLAVEALRSLRTSLHFAMMEAANNVIMLTGPVAALGKSFVSINLGAVLALSGKRVLVIDADLRRGRLQRYTGREVKYGLSDYIAGTVGSVDEIIQSMSVDGLALITAGTRPPNPSEILMSERFDNLIKTMSKSYDLVIVDTPPVLPVTDAAIVDRLAGTTLLVLKSADHPMRAIEETVKRLRQAGVQVKGTIFNQVGARVGSYGYGAYGYAYGYSSYGYRAQDQ